MGTSADTAIVDYRLSIVDLPFPFAANERKFAVPFPICCKQTQVAVFPRFLFLFAVVPAEVVF
jgi:hypothetical protein